MHAINSCLEQAGIGIGQLEQIVFYDKPLVKCERLLETYLAYAHRGFRSFVAAMPVWIKEKLYLKTTLKKEFARLAGCKERALPPLLGALIVLSQGSAIAPFIYTLF